jgi:hypothetical protein
MMAGNGPKHLPSTVEPSSDPSPQPSSALWCRWTTDHHAYSPKAGFDRQGLDSVNASQPQPGAALRIAHCQSTSATEHETRAHRERQFLTIEPLSRLNVVSRGNPRETVSGTAPEFFRLWLVPRRHLLRRPEVLSQQLRATTQEANSRETSRTPPVVDRSISRARVV